MADKTQTHGKPAPANAADEPRPIDADDLPDTDLDRVHGGSAAAAFARGVTQDACFIASIGAKTEVIH
ncbi:MAG TPA: hypothetical protein PK857_08945 [Hyphomicrobium sp.]|nr:hypothetical protein [Hyphomicrobium sp.]HRO49616.1 hypothetical protein [Hyphomicrobium sp.]